MTVTTDLATQRSVSSIMLHTSLELIGPKLAEKYLALNIDHNRRVNPDRVRDYSRQMQTGQWCISAPISFDYHGRLIDGQHRLHAIIHCGLTLEFLVIRGYPEKTVMTLDLGAKRTAANVAAIKGLKCGSREIAIVRSMLFPRTSHTSSVTVQEVVAIYEKYKESIIFAMRRGKANRPGQLTNAPIRAAVARAHAWGVNHQRLEEFIDVLSTGFPVSKNADEDSAAIALRNFYLKETAGKHNGGESLRLSFFYRGQGAIVHFLNRKTCKYSKELRTKIWPLPDIDEKPLHELLTR